MVKPALRAALRSEGSAAHTRATPQNGAPRKRAPRRKTRIALAMAGGGPLGAIYEIGALNALTETIDGLDLNGIDMYVGVSAGGIIGAGLANGITPRDMCAMFIEPAEPDTRPAPETAHDRQMATSTAASGFPPVSATAAEGARHSTPLERFDPAVLMRPALDEYGKRLRKVPGLLVQSAWHYLTDRRGRGWFDSFGRLTQAIPAGLFSNQGLLDFLTTAFNQPGRSNDFRDLKAKLFLVATDLDSGAAVAFGAPGHDHVPIAHAAVASAALPGLFPPVEIDGRYYLDGALKRTLHASIALKAGADLVLCLNPIVPYDDRVAMAGATTHHSGNAVAHAAAQPGTIPAAGGRRKTARHLIDGGLPVVLSQTLRAMVHSRMEIGMRQYDDDYGHADVVLFEPNAADADMFFTNAFSYSSRRRLCEHAYQRTRAELWQRRDELQPILARHGLTLNLEVLLDRSRRLVRRAPPVTKKRLLPALFAARQPLPLTTVTARLSASLAQIDHLVQVRLAQRASTALQPAATSGIGMR